MSSASTGGMDGLPREDISAKVTPTLIKNMGSPDWKVHIDTCLYSYCIMLYLVHKKFEA